MRYLEQKKSSNLMGNYSFNITMEYIDTHGREVRSHSIELKGLEAGQLYEVYERHRTEKDSRMYRTYASVGGTLDISLRSILPANCKSIEVKLEGGRKFGQSAIANWTERTYTDDFSDNTESNPTKRVSHSDFIDKVENNELSKDEILDYLKENL